MLLLTVTSTTDTPELSSNDIHWQAGGEAYTVVFQFYILVTATIWQPIESPADRDRRRCFTRRREHQSTAAEGTDTSLPVASTVITLWLSRQIVQILMRRCSLHYCHCAAKQTQQRRSNSGKPPCTKRMCFPCLRSGMGEEN